MRKPKQTGVWAYLRETGALETNDPGLIAKARADYRTKYMREYKRRKRRQLKEYVIQLGAQDEREIAAAAEQHRLSIPEFMRRSCMAYLAQKYVVADPKGVYRIQALLLSVITRIEDIGRRKEKRAWYQSDRSYAELAEAVIDIKNGVEKELMKPALVEQAVRDTLATDSRFRQVLLNILGDDSKSVGC